MATIFRVFVSSPGDVSEERVIAERTLRRLADSFAGIVRIEPVFWEHEPLTATESFQAQIPSTGETDVVVCILWARLGTRLPGNITRPDGTGYGSGTEFEFETAAEAFHRTGIPDLLVYRKTIEPIVSLKDEAVLLERLRQKRMLDDFVERWFHGPDGTLVAAFHPFQDAAQFEDLLEVHLGKLIERRILAAGLAQDVGRVAERGAPQWTAGSPYRGLEVFEMEHAPVFFGRTRAVGEVLMALRKQAADGRALVLVVGASGSGKSSLVRAGVVPLLTQPGVIEGVGLWRSAIFRPGGASGDVFDRLVGALVSGSALPELLADGTSEVELARLLRENPRAAHALLKGSLSQAASRLPPVPGTGAQPGARLVLVVDQLEELFTDERITPAERTGFVDALGALARGGRVWVVATLRSDLYALCGRLSELVELKRGDGLFDLAPPTPAEIGQLIRRPAEAAGLRFETDAETGAPLDDVLRDAALFDTASLPLLEFTLDELYKLRTPSGVLTHAAYEQLDGVEGALATRADAVFGALAEPVQASLPRVFRLLVGLSGSEGETPTRRVASLERLRATPEMRALTDALIAARLLTADQDPRGRSVVRVTHEALLTRWRPVAGWLDRDRELLRVHGRIAAAASRWDREGRRPDLLLPEGTLLDEGRTLAHSWDDELSANEREFIGLSLRRTRRNQRLKRSAVVGLAVLAFLAVGLAYAAERSRKAESLARGRASTAAENARQAGLRERAEADRARKEKRNAFQTLSDLYLERGRSLVEAGDSKGLLWLAQAVATAPADDPARQFAARITCSVWARLAHPLKAVLPVGDLGMIAPDGRTVLGISVDGAFRLWNTSDGSPAGPPMLQPGKLLAGHFTRSGKFAYTYAIEGEDHRQVQRLWDPFKGLPIGPPETPSLAFDDDHSAVIIDGAGSAQVWNLADRSPVGPPLSPGVRTHSALFSPGGKVVMTLSKEGKVALRAFADGKLVAPAVVLEGLFDWVFFSNDGNRLLTLNADRAARLWNTRDGSSVGPAMPTDGPVTVVDFSPDDGTVLCQTESGDASLWKTSDGTLVARVKEKLPRGASIKFTPDSQAFLVESRPIGGLGTARLWNATDGSPVGPEIGGPAGSVRDFRIFPDGQVVLALSQGPTAHFWDAALGEPIGQPMAHLADVEHVDFSPDGTAAVTRSKDGTARLWSAPDGSPLGAPMIRPPGSDEIKFSSDNRILLMTGSRAPVRLWSTDDGQPIGLTMTLPGWSRKLEFTRDGSTLVTAGMDDEVRLWDIASGRTRGNPMSHDHQVTVATFSRDGRFILTGTYGEARLWTSNGETLVRVFSGHTRFVSAAAFSPDGKTIVTGGDDKTARLWNADDGSPRGQPLVHEGEVRSVSFSPDGKTILTAGADGTARLWNAADGSARGRLLGRPPIFNSAAFSPDGRLIVTGGSNRLAQLWKAADGSPVGRPMVHAAWVESVAFSPDGKIILTGATDGTARFWNASDGSTLGSPMVHPKRLNAVAFSPDGKTVLTGSSDTTAQLWHAPAAIGGDPERIVLWIQKLTGMELTGEGEAIRVLDADTWQERRARLNALGGEP